MTDAVRELCEAGEALHPLALAWAIHYGETWPMGEDRGVDFTHHQALARWKSAIAAIESQAAPEVCRSLPAAEQAVDGAAMECIKAPWTGIAGSREGLLLACAALAKLRQGEGA